MAFPGVTHGRAAAPYIRISELRASREAATERRYDNRARRLANDRARARSVIDRVSLTVDQRVQQEAAENGSLKDEMQKVLRHR